MGVAEAHLGGLGQLLEPPDVLGIDEEDPDHPGRPGREEDLERPGGRPEVRLAFLLDQHIVEGEIAVAGEIEVAEPVPLEERGALGADVLGHGDRIGSGISRRSSAKPGHRLSDLPGLTERK